MRRFWLTALAALTLTSFAADLHVDAEIGDDALDGLAATVADGHGPLRTITLALRRAQPGDTVHLAAGQTFHQMADFYGLAGGEEGKPITLDGHGASLTGADPATADGWQPWRDGVLTRGDLVGPLVVDGAFAQRQMAMHCLEPGEVCYEPTFFNRLYMRFGPDRKPADYTVEVGQPDGTSVTLDMSKFSPSHSRIKGTLRYQGLKPPTWVKVDGEEVKLVDPRERLAPGQFAVVDGVLYYRPVDEDWQKRDIRVIVRQNGVQMNGATAWVTVRNLNVFYVGNDGYNIHGAVTHAEFYNCNARDCGDEGFSAHDACETLLDGAVYINCDNGIANVNNGGWSITRNVVLVRARSVGFLIENHEGAWHKLENAVLIDNPSQLSISRTTVDNVLVVQLSPEARCSALGAGPEVVIDRLTAAGNNGLIRLGAGSSLTLRRSLLAAGQGVIHQRLADPYASLKLENVVLAPEQAIEWGTKYPWEKLTAEAWLPLAGEKDAAKDCTLTSLTLAEALNDAEARGCTKQLLHWLKEFGE